MKVTDEDYSYVDAAYDESPQSDISEIRIDADNAWNGVQLKYGRVSARVSDDEEFAELSFHFEVTNQDPDTTEELENDTDFQNYAGDILTHIINTAFDKGDYRIGRDDNTDDNPAESSS